MKKYWWLGALIILNLLGSGAMLVNRQRTQTSQPKQDLIQHHGKVLVAYFSYSGTTQHVAQAIHRQVGGDLIRLQPQHPYSADYGAVSKRAGREFFGHASPAVKTQVDLSQYHTIFLGYPIWYGTAPMMIKTFLKTHHFKGKVIAPFDTYASSRLGHSLTLIRKSAPQARVVKGLAVQNADDTAIRNWLATLKFKR